MLKELNADWNTVQLAVTQILFLNRLSPLSFFVRLGWVMVFVVMEFNLHLITL